MSIPPDLMPCSCAAPADAVEILGGYHEFLSSKVASSVPRGIRGVPIMSPHLKAFQRDIVLWALRLGRAAIFAGTGLGKTLQQLSWAQAVADFCGDPVIVLAPLAVAQQTISEAKKFGFPSVGYAANQSEATATIAVTNYDRLDRFDLSKFAGIVLDESSIIKSHESQTRRALIEMCRDISFKLCCTATPAPNDYAELGNHSEFLGILSQKEMLATWFVHDGSIRATNVSNHGSKPVADWRLKGHAERDFWRWLSTWSVVVRHPSDLGYEEPGYDLPPLTRLQVTVPAEYAPSIDTGTLFPIMASTLQERLAVRRSSVDRRVDAAAKIVNASPSRPWLVWCNLNDEATALTKMIGGAVEVRGSDPPDVKAERLLGFANGEIRILVSKPSIAGWGMNFQRCADMVFVGLNDSFEQLYQAIRRCWRFGQTSPVTAWLIASELEGAVVANLQSKEDAADHMLRAMAEHMRDLSTRSLRGLPPPQMVDHSQSMELPTWLSAA